MKLKPSVRKKIGKPKFDPIYGFLCDTGVLPLETFRAEQLFLLTRQKIKLLSFSS